MKPEDLINSFKNDPYDFDPGKQFRYDNSGNFLLGYIVEKVSGATYNDFLKKTFFDPLGMTNTGVHRADSSSNTRRAATNTREEASTTRSTGTYRAPAAPGRSMPPSRICSGGMKGSSMAKS